jgi:cholesterol transport system auxiliary component
MNKIFVFFLVVLTGCATAKAPMRYDFGPVAKISVTCKPLQLTIRAQNPWDSQEIHYRLWHNPKVIYSYSQSLWGKDPSSLVKDAILERYYEQCRSLSSLPALRLEIIEFSHVFENATQSHGWVVADVFWHDGQAVFSRRISAKAAAATADADGGVEALHQASLLLADDVLQWLQQHLMNQSIQ